MEDQIKASLITLHKIAGFTSKTRIDTTSGDCDEFIEKFSSSIYRAMWDSRTRAREMLLAKYRAVKEHTKYIVQSRDPVLQKYIPQLRKQIEASRAGLTLYKSNVLYVNDKKITTTIDHLLEEEIPGQLAAIDQFNIELMAKSIAESLQN